MITKLSYWLAKYIATKAERNDLDYIRYGIEVMLSSISKLVIFIFIAFVFDIFLELFSIILSFAIFRVISGGVHMSTYLRCLASSIILFVVPAILIDYLQINFSQMYVILSVYTFSIIIALIYVPVEAENRPIPPGKHKLFKTLSIVMLTIWFVAALYVDFIFPNIHDIVLLSSLGLLIQSFTLTPIGYNILHTIDLFFQGKEKIWR